MKNTLYLKESPLSLEYGEAEGKIYVTTESPKLYSLDFKSAENHTEIQVGKRPWAIAQDEETDRLFVNNLRNNSVSVIDSKNNVFKTEIKVGKTPNDIAYDPADNQIFVADYDDSKVSVIDGYKYNITQSIPTGKGPSALYFDNKNKVLYVTNQEDNSLSIVKKDDNKNFSMPFTIAQNPDKIASEYFRRPTDVAVDPNNNLIFVS